MSIQPFPKGVEPATVNVTPDALLHRPEVSADVMRAISWWSMNDQLVALMAALCLSPTHLGVVTSVLRDLSGAEAARSVVRSIVRHSLEPDDARLFAAMMTCVRQEQALRNKFAHWLWGVSDEIPQKLVIIDPTTFQTLGDAVHAQLAGRGVSQGLKRKGLFVLSKNGAHIAVRAARQCNAWLWDFYALLPYALAGDPLADVGRSRLRSQPRIQDALSR